MTVLAGQLGPLGAARGAAAAPFSPLDLSPTFWIDAGALEGLSQGDPVTALADQSGTGYDFTLNGVAPTYSAAGVGGQPAITFVGSGHYKSATTASGWTSHTIFVVFNPSTVGAQVYGRLADKNNSVGGFHYDREGTTANRFGGGVGETGAPYGIYSSSFTDNADNLLVAKRATTTHTLYSGATAVAANSVGSQALPTNAFAIGGRSDNTLQRYTGMIAEVIFWASALSDTDRLLVTTYLTERYGL